MEKKWIYIGIFLNKESRNKLKELANKIVLDNWKLYCHHMTIAFNDGSKEANEAYNFYKNFFGAQTYVIATHIGISNDAIAVKVETDETTLNKIPHITLATPIDGKAVNSNYITRWYKLNDPINLRGSFSEFKK